VRGYSVQIAEYELSEVMSNAPSSARRSAGSGVAVGRRSSPGSGPAVHVPGIQTVLACLAPRSVRAFLSGREAGYVTLKFLMLVAVPAAVVTKMGPVSAPVSTLVTTRVAVSDTMVAAVPPKLTLVARPG